MRLLLPGKGSSWNRYLHCPPALAHVSTCPRLFFEKLEDIGSCPPRSSRFAIIEPIVCELGKLAHNIDHRPCSFRGSASHSATLCIMVPLEARDVMATTHCVFIRVLYLARRMSSGMSRRAFQRRACAAVSFSSHFLRRIYVHPPFAFPRTNLRPPCLLSSTPCAAGTKRAEHDRAPLARTLDRV